MKHLDRFKGAPLYCRLKKPLGPVPCACVLVSPLYYTPSVNGRCEEPTCAAPGRRGALVW